MRSGTISSKLC